MRSTGRMSPAPMDVRGALLDMLNGLAQAKAAHFTACQPQKAHGRHTCLAGWRRWLGIWRPYRALPPTALAPAGAREVEQKQE